MVYTYIHTYVGICSSSTSGRGTDRQYGNILPSQLASQLASLILSVFSDLLPCAPSCRTIQVGISLQRFQTRKKGTRYLQVLQTTIFLLVRKQIYLAYHSSWNSHFSLQDSLSGPIGLSLSTWSHMLCTYVRTYVPIQQMIHMCVRMYVGTMKHTILDDSRNAFSALFCFCFSRRARICAGRSSVYGQCRAYVRMLNILSMPALLAILFT